MLDTVWLWFSHLIWVRLHINAQQPLTVKVSDIVFILNSLMVEMGRCNTHAFLILLL